MNKDKWSARFQSIKEHLDFLYLPEDDDLDDLFESEEHPGGAEGSGSASSSMGSGESQGSAESSTSAEDGQRSAEPSTNAGGGQRSAGPLTNAGGGQGSAGPTTNAGDGQGNAGAQTNGQDSQGNADKWTISSDRVERRRITAVFSDDEEPERELTMEELLARNNRRRWMVRGLIAALILLAAGGFYMYNRLHTFNDYIISRSIENTMTSGTQYEAVGKYLYRYNSDGVSCVTKKNEVQWSITYSMQAPIVDVCGTTMVIAEQQGTQVYVVNEDGLLGSFTCLLPILKVRVSNQGVVAVVLQDDDVTWIRLYDAAGESIANDKTTISDSGYPLDIDLSPNGEKMVVSYLGITEGVMTSNVVFYDFGSGGDAASDYEVSRETFSGSAVPQVFFTDNTTAAAIADDGFAVFKGSTPTKTAEVSFSEEIVSCFYDDDRIGFLFSDTTGENEYRMELYNYNGKQKVSAGIDAEFDEIKMENGQILMYTSSSCSVFTKSGRLRYASAYEKEIVGIFYFKEFRRYLVITSDSFDRIRIC
ncbi:MAG: DUF5711 family protein [Lachnospiraceae bacterium]|nr:DUF5711 family protein [Lachnospiraceae bacterium]